MASETRNILGIGLLIPSSMDPDNTLISNETSRAKASNFNLDMYSCDTALPYDDVVSGLTHMLKSKKYAAISIGFGVRGNKDLTPLFEKLVNACIEHQPEVKLGFALLPTAVVEACARVLWVK